MRGNNDLRKKIEDYSYSLNDVLYQGLHSKVYKGINDKTKEHVAIKVIDIKNAKTKQDKKAMQCQIQVIRKLSHPNILKCFDVYSTVNNCYIITQYCEGGNLKQMLRKKKLKLKEQDALSIFKSIYKGCKYLFAKGLIHRNLVPSNILIKNGECKLADFGLTSNQSTYQIKTNSPLLKSLYHNPLELKKGLLKSRCDSYSLGVILFELYHKRLPSTKSQDIEFDNIDPNAKDLIKKLLTKQISLLSIDQLSNHPFINNVIQKYPNISQNRSNRLPSMTKIQSQIQNRPTSTKFDHVVQISSQKIQKSLNSQINFMKFLKRLFKLLSKSQIQFLIAKHILVILQSLNKSLQHNNVYESQNVLTYFSNKRGTKIQQKIQQCNKQYKQLQQVCMKYINKGSKDKQFSKILNEDYSQTQQMIINSIPVVLNYITTLLSQIKSCKQLKVLKDQDKLSGQLLKNTMSLDYLVTYYQLDCLCIQYPNDIIKFHQLSKIDFIVQIQPEGLTKSNIQDIDYKIKQLLK